MRWQPLLFALLISLTFAEEWTDSGAVLHLNDANWEETRAEHPRLFVMFYAPWCGHCKALKPAFAEASTKFDAIPLAAVDCTVAQTLCSKYKVQGYPTLLYFATSDSTEEGESYNGGRTATALVNFVRVKAGLEPEEEKEEGWEENGAVVHLSAAKFASHRQANPRTFVMFYAPWCGHCKTLKPDFAEASNQVKDLVSFAAVDCTVHGELCSQYKVQGYPTLIYFDSSEAAGETYTGDRSQRGLVDFAEGKSEVSILENLDGIDLSKAKIRLFKRILADRGAKCVGCTTREEYLKKVEEVKHLPSSKQRRQMQKDSTKSETKPKRTYAEIMKERRQKDARKVAEAGWEGDNGDVKHLIEDDVPALRANYTHSVIMFYAPWCSHCTSLKPEFVQASKLVKEDAQLAAVQFASVDCVTNDLVCKKGKINGFPTVKFFSDESTSIQDAPTLDGRTAKAIVKDIQKKIGAWKPQEWKNEPVWEENGDVQHLTEDYWPTFREQVPNSVVMFYAPWCGACKNFKPTFVEASTTLKSEITLGAVDCTEYGSLCQQFNVNSYPTIILFKGTQAKPIRFKFGSEADFSGWVRKKLAQEDAADEPEDEEKPEAWEENGAVIHLTKAGFHDFVKDNNVLVMFYAPWCGHCKSLKPAYASASMELQSVAFLAAVDCTKSQELCSEFGVQGYPTLKWFAKSTQGEDYNAGRSSNDLIEYVQNKVNNKGSKKAETRKRSRSSSDHDEL